jgi:DNA-binding HxlR family transcriptional regulator
MVKSGTVGRMSEATVIMTGKLDPRSGWEARSCPIARAVEAVGTRTAFLLMREAFYGTTRFDDFALRAGVSEPVAAARLKDLVTAGLLERVPYQDPGQRRRLEYRLTPMGSDFFPVLAALMRWGDRWLGPSGVQLRHRGCGAEVGAGACCEAGHPVAAGDTELASRPAAG